MSFTPAFQRIAVVTHPNLEQAKEEAARLTAHLLTQGVHAEYHLLYDQALKTQVQNGAFDLFISLGGDGTMLRSGHLCAPHGLPILGINMGRLGFLLEVRRGQWQKALPRLLAGDYWIEHRMMLQAKQYRDGQRLGVWDVLNEAMVGRGEIMRPVHLTTRVDGHLLTTYVADGLIAATPTGSTAYALAAGGPILPPELRNILIVPVAPHLSVDRAIVLAEGSLVSIQVNTDHVAALSVDGQPPVRLQDGDQVEVRAAKYSAQFVRLQAQDYFYRNVTSQMNKNAIIGERE